MDIIEKILDQMRRSPDNIRLASLCAVCDFFFGKPRQNGTSHRTYEKPWLGDPRINIQSDRGKAKRYQVKQVLEGVEKLNEWKNEHR